MSSKVWDEITYPFSNFNSSTIEVCEWMGNLISRFVINGIPCPYWVLTHWGWVTHICVSKLTIIDSYNGLSPGRRQAIIWTNAGILLIGYLGTNFSEVLIEIHIFSFKKIDLKMSSGEWRPFCLGLNVLKLINVSKRGPWCVLLCGLFWFGANLFYPYPSLLFH